MSREKLGFDLFGPFPDEGIWDWFDDLNAHYDGCCDLAAEHNVTCVGLYRPPDHSDLIRVRAAVKAWSDRPRLEYTDLAAEQAAVVRTKELLYAEDAALTAIYQEVRSNALLDPNMSQATDTAIQALEGHLDAETYKTIREQVTADRIVAERVSNGATAGPIHRQAY